jgi:hypothetical protein
MLNLACKYTKTWYNIYTYEALEETPASRSPNGNPMKDENRHPLLVDLLPPSFWGKIISEAT